MKRESNAPAAGVLEYFVRVKLPSPGGYHSGPSGDSEFEDAYKGAIFAAKPPGFEVKWPKLMQRWPVDSEGYTFVPLFLSDKPDALQHYMDLANELQAKIDRLRVALKGI